MSQYGNLTSNAAHNVCCVLHHLMNFCCRQFGVYETYPGLGHNKCPWLGIPKDDFCIGEEYHACASFEKLAAEQYVNQETLSNYKRSVHSQVANTYKQGKIISTSTTSQFTIVRGSNLACFMYSFQTPKRKSLYINLCQHLYPTILQRTTEHSR